MDNKEAKEIRYFLIQQAFDFINEFVDDEKPEKIPHGILMLNYQGIISAYSDFAIILGNELGKLDAENKRPKFSNKNDREKKD